MIDDVVIDRVAQPVVDFCSRRWGWHFVPFGLNLGRFAVVQYAAYAVLRYEWGWQALAAVIAIVLNLWILAGFAKVARRSERRGCVNSNRQAMPYRMVCVFFTAFSFTWTTLPEGLLFIGSDLFQVFAIYILSCQAGPPREVNRRLPTWSAAFQP